MKIHQQVASLRSYKGLSINDVTFFWGGEGGGSAYLVSQKWRHLWTIPKLCLSFSNDKDFGMQFYLLPTLGEKS